MLPNRSASWRTFPALLGAICFAVGVVIARCIGGVHPERWLAITASGAVCLIAMACRPRRRLVSLFPLVRMLATALVLAGAGGLRWTSFYTRPANHVAHRVQQATNKNVTAWGRVAGVPQRTAGSLRFRLSLHKIAVEADTERASGLVQVTRWQHSQEAPRSRLRQGDIIRVWGRLRPPPAPRNPADFDYGAYLRRQGIFAVLTVDEEARCIVGRRPPALGPLERITRRLRRYVRRRVRWHVPTPTSRHVVLALVLGERYHLRQATEDHFARTGLMHLLAVSGLHVLLVGLVFYRLLRPFLLRLGVPRRVMEWTRAALTLVVLGGYVALTGASASVVRAALMTSLWMGSVLLQRRTSPLNLLGVAAIVLLWLRPTQLFEVGFQLSFAAVVALVMLTPRFRAWLPSWCFRAGAASYVSNLVVASLAATLGTLPLLLFHFGRVSFAGLLLNVIAIPCTMLCLGAALTCLLTATVFPPVSGAFGSAASTCAQGMLAIARWGDAVFGGVALQRHVTSIWVLAAIGMLLAMLAWWPYPRRRWRSGLAALLLLMVGWGIKVSRDSARPDLEVVFFDVGHGDAALLTLPNHRHVLIDAGPRSAFSDRGARVVRAHLKRYGISRLDAVVISHAHSDHLGGLPTLLRSQEVGMLVYNGRSYSSALYEEAMHLTDSLHVPRRAVHAGDTLALDSRVRIQVLAPFRATAPDKANEASVVLRVAYGQTDFLFTGDIEKETEEVLKEHYGRLLASDVVKVAHHGSETSSTLGFVRAAMETNTCAVVSVGRRDRFGLPDGSVLRRWRRSGAVVYATGQMGAIWLRSDGKQVEAIQWRRR